MVNANTIPKDRVGYRSTIIVAEEGQPDKRTFQIVLSEEADAERGLVSMNSPLGNAFIGKVVGDEVEVRTPKGVRRFEILDLKTIHDEA
ncbi:MAG: GreA/GreB family elongation factor [Acidobacteriota bacterium]